MEMNFSGTLKPSQAQFSVLSILCDAKGGFNTPMDIKQIRRENMLALIEREASKAAFARKVGTDPAYISQILSTKTKADVGDSLARAIENAYGLEHGWMDNAHTGDDIEEAPQELSALWEQLTHNQRQAFIDQIKGQAETNRAIMEQLAPKDVVSRTVRVSDRRRNPSGFLPLGMQERRKKNEPA